MNSSITESQPLISVIIPAFNRATLIGETLDSVVAQTYFNWECIIVDDVSTDNTVEVINSYCKKDKRFRFFERDREPKGAPTCRNIGLESSQGEYIIFLDSDDILFKDALKTRVAFLNSHPEIDFSVSAGIRGEHPITTDNTYKLISTYQSKDVLKEFFNFTPPWVCLNPTYRRKSLINNNIFWDENIKGFQDIDFHTQTIVKNLRFEYLNNNPDCLWSAHDNGNIGKDMSKNGIYYEQKLYILNKYKDLKQYKIAVETLIVNILQTYFYTHIPDKVIKPTFDNINNSCVEISNFALTLLRLYRFSFKYKIPILPRTVKWILIVSENEKFIQSPTNKHFLACTYEFDN